MYNYCSYIFWSVTNYIHIIIVDKRGSTASVRFPWGVSRKRAERAGDWGAVAVGSAAKAREGAVQWESRAGGGQRRAGRGRRGGVEWRAMSDPSERHGPETRGALLRAHRACSQVTCFKPHGRISVNVAFFSFVRS